MGPEQWGLVRKLFHDALDVPPDQRPTFLAAACSDPEIRAEVESLLAGVTSGSELLNTPALEGAREALEAAISVPRTTERQARVKEILGQALDRDPAERESFVNQACGDDSALRAEVQWALAATGDLLDDRLQRLRTAESPLHPGVVLKGRYRIERQLGQGGFGRVFLAIDQQLHSRRVVVKALLDENTSDPWFERRFSEEIRALSTIDHPGVVGVLDSGRTDHGALYLVMQFAEGKTLRSLIQPGGMAFARVVGLVRQIAQALEAAHEKGIIHRDLKPENVIIQPLLAGEERVRLIDFGIARLKAESPELTSLTESTRVVGSPAYMAPEQLTGRASVESDIYALGVVTYELLTGRKPFQVQNLVELHNMQSAGRYPKPRTLRPDLPELAEQVVMEALAFRLEQRPRSAREFGNALAAALEHSGSSPLPERTPRTGLEIDRRTIPSRPYQYDVFVSHSSRDRELAYRLVTELETRGARCFISPRDVPTGQAFPQAVTEAVNGSRCLLLLLTEDANVSVQLTREVELANLKSTPVLALRMDGLEPSGDLAFFLSRPQWIDCSGELTPEDLDNLERAIHLYVPAFSAPEYVPPTLQPFTEPPDEPLFTEFGAFPLFGRPGQRRVSLIAFFCSWTLLTCLLSALADTGYITVMLVGPSGQLLPVRFGYLYELNGAFAYLFVVPWFAYFALGFVLEAQVALTNLASRDQIVVDQPIVPASTLARYLRKAKALFRPRKNNAVSQRAAAVPETVVNKGVLELIGEANRRWMNRVLLTIVFVGTALIIVGTEYLPPMSDYKHVMFGYVQAPWIADYPRECPNCTLGDLERRLNRSIEPLGGLTVNQVTAYRIVEPYYRRSGTIVERSAFVLFMISVLGLEVAFVTFIIWIVVKAFFFLQLIYRAAVPTKSIIIGLHLRYTDPSKIFGLESIHRALRLLVATIMVSVALPVLAWWTNVLKGSRRAIGQDVYALGGWGQFLISNGSFVMAVALLLYLVYIGGKAREAASEESKRLASLPQRGRGSRNLEQLLDLIAEQSVWRNPRYTIAYVLAPLACVIPVLTLNRVSIAYQVGNAWEFFLRYMLGKE